MTGTNGTGKQGGRVKILKLAARNVKTLREVEIDGFGEVFEIRGDTGQGKTSILEAIEGGLRGLDPSMVRQGQDALEVVLELDNARIQRIVRTGGAREMLTVTDRKSGKPIDRAKEFLKALCPEGTIFRPLDFVLLGSGDTKGKTERLRQQRNMLLDAMPVRLTPEMVEQAIGEIGEDALNEATGLSGELAGIDWEQHGLAVCSALERVFYESRKAVNAAADDAESMLKHTARPQGIAPALTLAQCRTVEEAAKRAYYQAQATQTARAGTVERKRQLEAAIERDAENLEGEQELRDYGNSLRLELQAANTRMEEIRRELAELEARAFELRETMTELRSKLERHERLKQSRAELESLKATMVGGPNEDVTALESAMQRAVADTKARELQDVYDAAAAKAIQARRRAETFDRLVKVFRDELPKRIVAAMRMPVPGLGINGEMVTYNGTPLHQLGTSEQIYVGVRLAAALNPQTGFVLVDRAESLGKREMAALAQAARELDLQIIMSVVDADAKPGPNKIVMHGGQVVS